MSKKTKTEATQFRVDLIGSGGVLDTITIATGDDVLELSALARHCAWPLADGDSIKITELK